MIIEKIKMFFLSIFFPRRVVRRFKDKIQSKKEQWGVYDEAGKARTWDLPRFIDLYTKSEENDSRAFLEGLGFHILGITCKYLYRVSVPEGYKKKRKGTSCWYYVFDKNGNRIFKFIDKHKTQESNCYILKK